jgi:transposase-like protein
MSETAYRSFFLQPTDTWHRRYEALRAYFIEQQPLDEVARRNGVSYGTLCNWVSQFRGQCDAGQRPPFSKSGCPDDRSGRRLPRKNRTFRLPMSRRCR